MAMSFNNIPSGTQLKVPLFYAEMDNSAANAFTQNQRTLLIGQKLAAGVQASGQAVLVGSLTLAKQLFGVGSMLARMYEFYRLNDAIGEVWCVALDDNAAGVYATGTVTITGPATAAGTLNLYITGQRIQVAVSSSDTATVIAAAIVAAVNAATDLPVTAANTAGVVTLTARHKGSLGNDIDVRVNYRGVQGGESTPSGVGVAIVAMASGATDPSLSTAITAMGDEEYDFIIEPYTDSANLDLLKTELNDSTGRWSYFRQIYGHAFSAKRGSQATLVTFGGTRNDQHVTVAGFETNVPNPCWEYVAAYGARNAAFLRDDPARPTQTGVLTGLMAAPAGQRFLWSERNALLGYGIATSFYSAGNLAVERSVTTYQKNSYNQADASYMDIETMFTSAYVLRQLRYEITQRFPRHKLADDGTRFGPGQAIVTPKVIRGVLINKYAELEYNGIVENAKLFEKNLIVERDNTNPNRLNVLLPPDYVNQLRVFALLNQFRLQYPQGS